MNGKLIQLGKNFFSWWGKELFALCPVSMQRKFQVNENKLLLQVLPEGVRMVWVHAQRVSDLGLFPLDARGRRSLQERCAADAGIRQAERILVLTPKQCINRRFQLPKQAASNLHQVMEFEMDRFTPFRADQVAFDVLREDASTLSQDNQIRVHLAAAPQAKLETLLGDLAFFNLSPTVVSFSEQLGMPLDGSGFNLLPKAMRPPVSKKEPIMIAGLMLLLLLELVAVIVYPGWRAKQEAVELQRRMDAIQPQLRAVSDMQSEIEQIRTRVDSVLDKTARKPYVLDVMKELTSLLPDHTWLTRMQLRGNRLQIQGYSERATTLIQLLDDSTLFENTRFSSPLASSRADQQAFKISLDVKEGAHVSAAH